MTDEGCVLATLTGCLALHGTIVAQAGWLVVFVLGWAWGAAAAREKARQLLIPGGEA